MNPIIEEISKIGIVPVIALENAKDAAPLAEALYKGGLPCAEITFRTEAAEESIRVMSENYPDMLVGAGTVLTIEQADRAIDAGAGFIVSPGLNPKVVKHCVERGVPILPGTANPSDVEAAIELGLEVVKFFPAEAAGGIEMIKAMSAPYHRMKFMPTGGITADNLKEYLDFNKVVACGGSFMVRQDLIREGKFHEIQTLTKEAVSKMLGFELRHVGINTACESDANAVAGTFEAIFGMTRKEGASSIFVDSGIEVMKTPYLGANGHIAFATNYIDRAVYHLERQGVVFNKDTFKRDEKGNLKTVYMEDEVGGFALHLIQK